MMKQFEAVVVGAGPAGIAAALELTKYEVNTAIVDDAQAPGGQVYRRSPADFKALPPKRLTYRQRTGHQLTRALLQSKEKLTIFPQSSVWGSFEPFHLQVLHNDQILKLAYQKLIICEGANERIIPFPGWTLPGIMTMGGMQKLIRHQRLIPGKRILLAGSGPLLIAAAAELIQSGADMAGVLEAAKLSELTPLLSELLRQKGLLEESVVHTIPLLKNRKILQRRSCVVEAHGKDRVEAVTICQLDDDWRPIAVTKRVVETDAVGIGFGFKPGARLSRLFDCQHYFDSQKGGFVPVLDAYQAADQAGIYIAGDAAGIGGATMAEIQGRIAGLHAAYSLGRVSKKQFDPLVQPLIKNKAKAAKYSNKLAQIFTPRDALYQTITPETIICRCEGVTAGEIWDQMRKGRLDLTSLKPARLGMGPCQGRGCESIAAELLRLNGVDSHMIAPPKLRPPLIPLPISVFENNNDEISE
jgi:NADPH-dependent 2,4-dienoyl-CoA reductase/sulfur reductase-like enzyme